LVGEESVLPANQTLATHLHDASSVGVGSGWQLDGIASLLANTYAHVQPDARALALLAEGELSRGEVSASALIEPTYLRNEVTWKKHTPIRNR
jgi:tRNA A37 threonylcarbamoyladenosine modification protein TsaB